MRALRCRAVLFSLVLGTGAAGDEPPATPTPNPQSAPQHVTVPSLPGEQNKEGVVRPDGGMPMDSEGYAVTKRYDPGAPPAKGAPGAATAPAGTAAPAAGAGSPAPAPVIPVGPAPSGKATVTGANYASIRGAFVSTEPGKSLTLRIQKTGAAVTYTLAPGTVVPPGLEPGKTVRVRALIAEKGRVVDQVEIVAPAPPTPAKKEQKP